MKYMLMLRDRAPSHVARIRLPEVKAAQAEALTPVRPEPVYDDDGEEIAACSVAAPYRTTDGERRFIVGACFADHAIVCRAPSPA